MTSRAMKGSGIDFVLPDAASTTGAGPAAPARPGLRTGIALNSAAIHGNKELQLEVERLKAERGAVKLDPKLICRSKWANRIEAEFSTAEFALLKEEIASAGGNIQPVKVRPVAAGSATEHRYEIVFGHRRHQACAELGLPVLSVIEEVSDEGLFAEMDRENRARKDLSLYEQGISYKRALDSRLFPSQRRMAEVLGVSQSMVSEAVQISELPKIIIAAFRNPQEIQRRWAKPLADSYQKDPNGMSERAKALGSIHQRSAAEVFEHLLNTEKPEVKETPISVGGKRCATLRSRKGKVSVDFEVGALPAKRHAGLVKLIQDYLGR